MTRVNPARQRQRDEKLLALGQRPPWWRLFSRRRWKREYAAIMAIDVSDYAAILARYYDAEFPDGMVSRRSTASLLSRITKDKP